VSLWRHDAAAWEVSTDDMIRPDVIKVSAQDSVRKGLQTLLNSNFIIEAVLSTFDK
jgi:hypothetical protein